MVSITKDHLWRISLSACCIHILLVLLTVCALSVGFREDVDVRRLHATLGLWHISLWFGSQILILATTSASRHASDAAEQQHDVRIGTNTVWLHPFDRHAIDRLGNSSDKLGPSLECLHLHLPVHWYPTANMGFDQHCGHLSSTAPNQQTLLSYP